VLDKANEDLNAQYGDGYEPSCSLILKLSACNLKLLLINS
jgi:hypothetical protein